MAVAQRLVAHCEHLGFRAIVIYVDPRHREVFATERFVILDESPHLLVLTTPPGTGTEAGD
jgi:hypothetical protein